MVEIAPDPADDRAKRLLAMLLVDASALPMPSAYGARPSPPRRIGVTLSNAAVAAFTCEGTSAERSISTRRHSNVAPTDGSSIRATSCTRAPAPAIESAYRKPWAAEQLANSSQQVSDS